MPTIEQPMRVVQQITAIARGLLGLGLDDGAVAALARRVALDSMPAPAAPSSQHSPPARC